MVKAKLSLEVCSVSDPQIVRNIISDYRGNNIPPALIKIVNPI